MARKTNAAVKEATAKTTAAKAAAVKETTVKRGSGDGFRRQVRRAG